MSIYSDYPTGELGFEPEENDMAGRSAPTPRKSARRRRRRGGRLVLSGIGWFFKILGTLLLIGVVTGCFVACYGAIYIQTTIMPEAERFDLSGYVLNEPSTVYYTDKVTGQPVAYATLVGNEDRIILESNEIPLVFKDVAVSIEDKRFYSHKGVDWIRTGAAVIKMFTGQSIQGGSTITQQVIKNSTQNDEVTVKRKVLEIFQALSVETKYNKDEILTIYLNKINLGGKVYGIGAASRYYFDKDVSEITLPEAASIIAITNNPSLYSPYSTVETRDSKTGEILTGLERNKRRQEDILWVMCYGLDEPLITEKEFQDAVNAPLNFTRGQSAAEKAAGDINSWYTDQVIAEVVEYFVNQGYDEKTSYDLIYSAGLHIYTPFDPDVQESVDAVYENLNNLPYISKDGQQMQSCITIVDNETGYVVAMAGAMGEKNGNLLWNYATDTTRQPGSSIKPLSVYGPAIEMGKLTPYSIVDDAPYQLLNGNPWPVNAYEGFSYRGLTTVTEAVTKSLNTVAVRVLSDYVSPEASYRFLEDKLGITTLESGREINGRVVSDVGSSQLALGGMTYGLSPYEMAAAYAIFPRGGKFTPVSVVHRVENRDHMIIWDNTPKDSYPIKESTAYYMNELLQNVVSSGTGTGARLSGMHVAGKTGTTTDNYDLWFAGYTPYYTGVVWTGYPYNADIADHQCATRMWKLVMERIHAGLADQAFPSVPGLTSYDICLDCGLRATENCANDLRGSRVGTFTFVDGTQPSSYCTCHVGVSVCSGGVVMGEDGLPMQSGFCKPGPSCPYDTQRTVYMVDHSRNSDLVSRVSIADQAYMLSSYEALPECPFHSGGLIWQDPNGWPSTDPVDPWDPGPGDDSQLIDPPVNANPGGSEPPASSDPPASDSQPGSETPGEETPPDDEAIPA